ncbi:alanine racemase [Staphylococcus sp. SQ8-PEA]|uniref:Alanine racemase n=1 Tax=Staphylococcus marylandisciuri TaxID=2981529 RepID=A0ABT2QSK5_9STAP|nr:alanine racemase [Staphylococcus marylandisciuri]MCU5746934.1 alanine racemase [Staphylococcus marylandisciuri]
MDRIKAELEDCNQDYYIYDLTALERRIKWLTSVTEHRLFYAVKANSDERIIATLAPYVAGFEVASPGEIQKVRSVSKDATIIYGGPVKTKRNLSYALDNGVQSIQVESLFELDSLAELLDNTERHIEVMLRINLSDIKSTAKLKMAGVPTQFGLPEEDLDEAFQLCDSIGQLTLVGFHFHSMSNNLDVSAHVSFIEKAIQFTHNFESRLPGDYAINVGGGIGIDYAGESVFDFDDFANEIKAFPRLTFELGRFITAPVGYYAAAVYDIKTMHNQTFALLNGGTNHFRFPKAWYHNHPLEIVEREMTTPSASSRSKQAGASHQVEVEKMSSDQTEQLSERVKYSTRQKEIRNQEVTLAGKLCTPNDVFGPPYVVDSLATGDWIVFKYAGSYSYDISHLQFLSHDLPIVKYI